MNNRKPMIAMMLALVLILLAAATLAEGSALPAYVYPFADEDPVGAAVVDYMLNNDFGFTIEEGGVLIPTPVILKEETNEDKTEATVYGNFWIFAYKADGKILKVTAGGECPGIMKLEKKDGAWKVASFESAGDGEQYSEDIVRFANGDKELEEMYFRSSGAAEDSILDQYQRVAVVEYVKANQLDIEAYQDYGSDPVSVTD